MVLLDANALMMPVQFGIDLFEELRSLLGSITPVILEEVTDELRGIAKRGGRNGAAARVALRFTEQYPIEPRGEGTATVDSRLMRFAEMHGCLVVTNDRDLRDLLLSQGIGVISMRKQKRLELMMG